jgi:uncharacterized protein DUF4838
MATKSGDINVTVSYPAGAGEVVALAARELAGGLAAMLGREGATAPDPAAPGNRLVLNLGAQAAMAPGDGAALPGDSFEIGRAGDRVLTVRAGSARGLLHGACDLLERLGARFIPGAPAAFPRVEASALAAFAPYRVTPAFSRRAFASDIMTWNYSFAERLELHLKFDREFVPWMGRRGINAFEYIRHAHDTRLRIDELVPFYQSWGIGSEYGGHVLQILMPRERFQSDPQYFPMAADGTRMARGNLCVSNPDAVRIVSEGALGYIREYPENRILHIWGADVSKGAWCNCPECSKLSPQLQYMKIVNAIASAEESAAGAIPVTYLAYHDTIDPDPKLRPLPNVWFEWAPRERCYVHAIDDSACTINGRYFDSLRGYVDLFQGRGQVFEYYADAILFAGLGFATPAVIARDLRAYRKLGIDGISCLTFGAYSALTYPVNIEAFARGTRSLEFDPDEALTDTAAVRHPAAADAMGKAYRAIEKVAALVLDYADVMRPFQMPAKKAGVKKGQLSKSLTQMRSAIKAAEKAASHEGVKLAGAEAELWNYGLEVLSALGDYLRAREEKGVVRTTLGESAIANIAGAIDHIRKIDPAVKGTWGAYDLEWIRELWLDRLRKNLAEGAQSDEEIF